MSMKYLESVKVDGADIFSLNLLEATLRMSEARIALHERKYIKCEIFLHLVEQNIFMMTWMNSLEHGVQEV